MKTLIGTPTRGKIEFGTMKFLREGDVYFSANSISPEFARYDVCRYFLKGVWTHLFFLDDDVIPPVTAIDMLASHDEAIVTGLYALIREGEIISCAYKGDGEWANLSSSGFFEIQHCGLGACLIKREVIEKAMQKECFDMKYKDGILQKGEDVVFCETVRSLGYKIFCDANVKCDHIKKVSLRQMGGY